MIDDKDLIRRALLGDQDAQKQCTEKGIVLPCPFCGSENIVISNWGLCRVWCQVCLGKSDDQLSQADAIRKWNTRPAPPIGKCGECKYSRKPTEQDYEELDRYSLMHKDACVCTYDEPKEVWKFDFCSNFKPREE